MRWGKEPACPAALYLRNIHLRNISVVSLNNPARLCGWS